MTKTKLTALKKEIKSLIEKAIDLWVEGNNSGNEKTLIRLEAESQKKYDEAEKLVKEHFPQVTSIEYNGLYPTYKVKGYDEYNVENMITSAMDLPRNYFVKAKK